MSRTPRVVWRAFASVAVSAFVLSVAACGGGGSSGGGSASPAAPSSPSSSVSLAGAWHGTANDSTGGGLMDWQLSQSGGTVSGTIKMSDDVTHVTGDGTLSGTLSGSTLQFLLTIPVNGFSDPDKACSLSVSGSASATASRISGTFTGTNTCGPASLTGGELSMTKQ